MSPKKAPLRGSVRQNRARVREQDGIGGLAWLGIFVALGVLLLIVVIVGWRSGWPHRTWEKMTNDALALTQKAEFQVNEILVEGRQHLGKDAIFDALGVKQGLPILGVDIDAATKRLGKLPWVDKVRIERRLPGTITVILTERTPMARWQNSGRFHVIDTRGEVLATADAKDFPRLPQVVGAGADRETKNLLFLLNAYPEIREKMASAVRVSERRWDLHLSEKIVVRLPETNVDNALRRLSVLMSEEKILNRNISSIDLRITDRLILEPRAEPKQAGDSPP